MCRLDSRIGLLKITIATLLFATACAAQADVLKMVVDDTINPVVTERFQRAIAEAERTHADALLVELRTPGGLVRDTREIIHSILAAKTPVIIFVAPSGSNAASAGFFILESADVAAMAPGTNTGAAHPVAINPFSGSSAQIEPVMKEKLENDAAALMRSFTGKRGRNVQVAESAVRQSKSFSADEALSQHLIDFTAKEENDLFRQLDGKTITRFDGTQAVLHLSGKPVRLLEMTLKQEILSFLLDPNISFLILAIGALSIYFEFNHPGAVIPGVVGFVAVLLALYALNLLPFRSIALVMILASFALFILEAKYQTHGAAGLGGVALMVLGALLLVDGPIPEMRVHLWTALSVSIPLGIITIFLMSIALKARRNKVVTGEQGMVGEIGVVTGPLTPTGKVLVQGEIWDAVAPYSVEVGQRVIVRKVENLVLHVEQLREFVPQATVAG